MNRRSVLAIGLLAAACGGASKNLEGQDKAEEAEKAAASTPLWEKNVDNAAYEFYRSVSRTLLRTKQPQKASRAIQPLFKLDPDGAEPYYLMGWAYTDMEQYDTAQKMFLKAIEKDPKYAEAYSMLGVVLNKMGEHRKAEKMHLKAIELNDSSALFRNNLGFCYYLDGRYGKAVMAYQQALELDPGARRIHNNLGFAYGIQGQFEAALGHFKMAGLPAQASNNMGFIHESRGELERAYEYYELALRQDPELVQAAKNLERLAVALGRPVPDIVVKKKMEEQGPKP